MRKLLQVAAILALAACSPAPPAAPPPGSEAQATPGVSALFMSPSGNIGCIYTPTGGTAVYSTSDGRAELSCDRSEPTYVRVVMSEEGPARIVETDERGCCSGETIRYGDRWNEGSFTCDVTEQGVACTSANGHGFTLSRSEAGTH